MLAHIACMCLIPAQIAGLGPAIKCGFAGVLKTKISGAVAGAAADQQGLSGIDGKCIAAAFVADVAGEYRHPDLAAILRGIETIAAVAVDHKAALAGVDPDAVAGVAAAVVARANIERAALQVGIDIVVIDSDKIEDRVVVDTQSRCADTHFGAALGSGPQRIFAGHRKIQPCGRPAFLAIRIKRGFAFGVADAANAAWWISPCQRACRRAGSDTKSGKSRQQNLVHLKLLRMRNAGSMVRINGWPWYSLTLRRRAACRGKVSTCKWLPKKRNSCEYTRAYRTL